MPYLIKTAGIFGGQEVIQCTGTEPIVEPSPWLYLMLSSGRSLFDQPGEQMPLTDKLRALVPHTVYVKRPSSKGVPDIFNWDFPVVSERFMAKLEELEPGAHEFFPVTVKRDDGSQTFGRWYILYLRQMPDIIDHDNTLYSGGLEQEPGPGAESGVASRFHFKRVIDIKRGSDELSKSLINFKPGGLEGRHLWRGTVGDAKLYETREAGHNFDGQTFYIDPLCDTIFASDELGQFIKDENIRGWDPKKILQKPVAWFFEQKAKGLVV